MVTVRPEMSGDQADLVGGPRLKQPKMTRQHSSQQMIQSAGTGQFDLSYRPVFYS